MKRYLIRKKGNSNKIYMQADTLKESFEEMHFLETKTQVQDYEIYDIQLDNIVGGN